MPSNNDNEAREIKKAIIVAISIIAAMCAAVIIVSNFNF